GQPPQRPVAVHARPARHRRRDARHARGAGAQRLGGGMTGGGHDPLGDLLDFVASHFFGKYRGLVVDNADPTDRGRLQVKVPAVLGDEAVWALPCVPYAGAGVGFYALPEAGTAIWVEFEAGDPSFPVWTGCFWGDGELPDP